MNKKNMLISHPRWIEILSKEWDYEKNDALGVKPDDIFACSHVRVWWKCSHGHEWDAMLPSRTTQNAGCPYCSGTRVIPGVNDLATLCPDIASEWHPTKNGGLEPNAIGKSSDRKVWWFGECGHEWQARVSDRASGGTNCPYCAGKRVLKGFNDLATLEPEIASEWHPTKNGKLTPENVTSKNNRKVWWQGKCGHQWDMPISKRTTRGYGCPYCAGKRVLPGFNDLATLAPELASEWHPTKNGKLTPKDVVKTSNKKAWWVCDHGHEWHARISNRTAGGNNCPVCSNHKVLPGFNDLATLKPELAAEWHPTKNGELTPEDVTSKSNKNVWWLGKCGHEWNAIISNRTHKGNGCPICSSSHGEQDAIAWAKSVGFIVKEQWTHKNCKDKQRLPFDMMIYEEINGEKQEIALIEYDGEQHSNPDMYFSSKLRENGESQYEYIKRHDRIKDEFCKETGRLLIRIPYTITGKEAIGEFIENKLIENWHQLNRHLEHKTR